MKLWWRISCSRGYLPKNNLLSSSFWTFIFYHFLEIERRAIIEKMVASKMYSCNWSQVVDIRVHVRDLKKNRRDSNLAIPNRRHFTLAIQDRRDRNLAIEEWRAWKKKPRPARLKTPSKMARPARPARLKIFNSRPARLRIDRRDMRHWAKYQKYFLKSRRRSFLKSLRLSFS